MIHKSSVNAISPFPHTQSIIHRFRIDDEILGPWALKLASKIWLLLCFTSFFFLLPFFFLIFFGTFVNFFCVIFFFDFFSRNIHQIPFHPAKKNIQIQTDLTKNKTNFFYGTREKKLIIIIIMIIRMRNTKGTFSHEM